MAIPGTSNQKQAGKTVTREQVRCPLSCRRRYFFLNENPKETAGRVAAVARPNETLSCGVGGRGGCVGGSGGTD